MADNAQGMPFWQHKRDVLKGRSPGSIVMERQIPQLDRTIGLNVCGLREVLDIRLYPQDVMQSSKGSHAALTNRHNPPNRHNRVHDQTQIAVKSDKHPNADLPPQLHTAAENQIQHKTEGKPEFDHGRKCGGDADQIQIGLLHAAAQCTEAFHFRTFLHISLNNTDTGDILLHPVRHGPELILYNAESGLDLAAGEQHEQNNEGQRR
ncbi:hypothetical protein D3C73_1030230 [compost metagenome]